MAGSRSLWRANGMKEEQFGLPIIGIVNSFSQLAPGHIHLHEIGQYVKSLIEQRGCFAAEFNAIAIEEVLSMGHEGMLYSLPSRDLIADSIEYMANAHRIDALFCISNGEIVTSGMLMAAMCLNIPTIFVSGGPMESGTYKGKNINLTDAQMVSADKKYTDEEIEEIEKKVCPGCGSVPFTLMDCLTEALGMALPGNGTIPATHTNRRRLFEKAASVIVQKAGLYYFENDDSVLPRSIATKAAFENAMAVNLAMGGSSNTVLHLLAIAREAGVNFSIDDADRLSRKIPVLCNVASHSGYHMQDINRAGGVMAILGELKAAGLIDSSVRRVGYKNLEECLKKYNIRSEHLSQKARKFYLSAPAGQFSRTLGSQSNYHSTFDTDRIRGCIRDIHHAYLKEGGLAVLKGNLAPDGCIVKTTGEDQSIFLFEGNARVYESQEQAMEGILNDEVKAGEVVVIRYEGPKGGPGMPEMLYPALYLKSKGLDKVCALISDGRFSDSISGLSVGHISPEAASGGIIAILQNGDPVEINIPAHSIEVKISPEEIEQRLSKIKTYQPLRGNRFISRSLKIYAEFVSSAVKGAVREL